MSLTRADGLSILGNIPVVASLSLNLSIRAGADALGRARLYVPFPVASGSSGFHYDTIASRNLLMEPAVNADLTHNVKAPDDLTLELHSLAEPWWQMGQLQARKRTQLWVVLGHPRFRNW